MTASEPLNENCPLTLYHITACIACADKRLCKLVELYLIACFKRNGVLFQYVFGNGKLYRRFRRGYYQPCLGPKALQTAFRYAYTRTPATVPQYRQGSDPTQETDMRQYHRTLCLYPL